jgi:hypothetical protein
MMKLRNLVGVVTASVFVAACGGTESTNTITANDEICFSEAEFTVAGGSRSRIC